MPGVVDRSLRPPTALDPDSWRLMMCSCGGRGCPAIRWGTLGCCALIYLGVIMGAPQDWPRWAMPSPHLLAATVHLDNASEQPTRQMMTDRVWLLDRALAITEAAQLAHFRLEGGGAAR